MGGGSFSCALYGFVGISWSCGPCLGQLASRIPSRVVTLMVFLHELILYPVYVPVASAVAAGQVGAQDLLDAFSSVAGVGVFPQTQGFRASFGELCSCLGNFSACAQILMFFISVGFSNYSPGSCGGVAI